MHAVCFSLKIQYKTKHVFHREAKKTCHMNRKASKFELEDQRIVAVLIW